MFAIVAGIFFSRFMCDNKTCLCRISAGQPPMPVTPDVSEKAQKLIKALVERYIADGQPVGSKTLLEQANLQVSAATVRNIMADLEEKGYVTSPHTSAGRVPTARAYRLFVDSLIRLNRCGTT